jgi:hypothetical protein
MGWRGALRGEESLSSHLFQDINSEKELIMLRLEETGEAAGISMAELGTERRHVSELSG